jgi:multiple sugar transport system ATP-binding protein
LTLGIRPPDLTPAEAGWLTGRIVLVERLGNETIVNLDLPSGASVFAVLDGDKALTRGETLSLVVDPAKALLFNQDGRALLPPTR